MSAPDFSDFRHVINVIESPSADDILEDRREGYALISALRLSGIQANYFAVSNRATLAKVFNALALAPAQMQRISNGVVVGGEVYVSQVHLSAHGNEHGLGLTDGSFVTWHELSEEFAKINRVKGYIGTTKKRGMVSVSLSCCRGYHAKAMVDMDPSPVMLIVGSESDIPWADSVVAWITFYHNFITKNQDSSVAIQRMNIAAGGSMDLFKQYA